jgi:hypothetical protein
MKNYVAQILNPGEASEVEVVTEAAFVTHDSQLYGRETNFSRLTRRLHAPR